MPYPAQIDRDIIITTARDLIEAKGRDAITLRAVASALGVKAPSLYRHVKNKDAMLLAINEMTIRELFATLNDADDSSASLTERLVNIARTYRQYAHDHPVCYELAMSSRPEIKPSVELQVELILPLQALLADLTNEEDSLPSLRGVSAFLHGWVSLEINQQLQRGGDLDAHFERSFRAFLLGWQHQSNS